MCLVRSLDVEMVDDNLFVGVTSVSDSVGWSSPRTTEDQEKDQDWTAKDQDHTVVFVSPVLVLVLVLCTFKFCRTTQDQSGPVLDWSI